MSGQITSNVFRSSGVIAPTVAGLNWSSAVITGTTLSAEAANGYYINTTSNACTVTLPSSATIGDQIVLVDYARTWSTNNLIIDSNGLNFQGDPDTYTVDYSTAGQSLSIVYSDATKGWLPVSDDAVADAGFAPPTEKAIFAYGRTSTYVSMSNLVNSSGVVAADVSGVGTVRTGVAASGYGFNKAIFAYGFYSPDNLSLSNLVNSSGVVAADTTGVGTARNAPAGVSYGISGQAMFAYGYSSARTSLKNLVTNQGVVGSDVTGVGTVRHQLAAAGYGVGLAIFGYGSEESDGRSSITNKVNINGVIASDTSGVGTERTNIAAAGYGTDKAIFAYGQHYPNYFSLKNLVNNVGVVAADVTGVGTSRATPSAARYGNDKAIFAFGYTGSNVSVSNLVNNSGVVASDVSGVGSARRDLAAAEF